MPGSKACLPAAMLAPPQRPWLREHALHHQGRTPRLDLSVSLVSEAGRSQRGQVGTLQYEGVFWQTD